MEDASLLQFVLLALVLLIGRRFLRGIGRLVHRAHRLHSNGYQSVRRNSTGHDAHLPPSHLSLVAPSLQGHPYVIDGDTIAIRETHIRLFGIDAPELNHPYGERSKRALAELCSGQVVRAEIKESDKHGRTVARCFLPDGRDLSAEMVKAGLAIDWPKFSGGAYAGLERPGVRKRLWLADARQKGRMHVWEQFEARQRTRRQDVGMTGGTRSGPPPRT